PSTATSVNRLVRPASSTRPPATGYLLPPVLPKLLLRSNSVLAPAAGLAGPGAGRPVEPELARGEPHGQLERPRWRYLRVLQRDQNGQPVQHRRQGDGEVVRVDAAELPAVLAGQDHVADRLPPPLVELLPDRGHPRVAGRLGPQVQPQHPGTRHVRGRLGQAGHGDDFLE